MTKIRMNELQPVSQRPPGGSATLLLWVTQGNAVLQTSVEFSSLLFSGFICVTLVLLGKI